MSENVWVDGERICTVRELKERLWKHARVPNYIYESLSKRDYWVVLRWLNEQDD
ncbi:hypothetical protein NB569_04650 [Vibrio alginolyticus]|uniref:hypothetical protein n=1 Tax=Vibrio alginolyticus TaxID=663 RepID=UPI00215C6011|nr:hypothetical protein [Vibrio alginolyticus]MCR9921814.1 hypothetical protein [Vibrio alginolyticus]